MAIKRKMHHKKKFTIPVAIVAGFLPMAMDIMNTKDSLGIGGAIVHSSAGALIGYDTVGKRFNMNNWKAAGGPAIWIGFAAHFAAQKFGINRMIARAGIPLIRI
jgi:hypothetical protein